MTVEFKIRALSIQQPWAWLIVQGHKCVENRTWATKFRGSFLVHAGKTVDRDGVAWVQEHFPEIQLPTFAVRSQGTDNLGGIIGIASLVACVEPKDSSLLTSRDAPWYNKGCHAFVLEDAKSLPFIRCRGMLGFFTPKVEA